MTIPEWLIKQPLNNLSLTSDHPTQGLQDCGVLQNTLQVWEIICSIDSSIPLMVLIKIASVIGPCFLSYSQEYSGSVSSQASLLGAPSRHGHLSAVLTIGDFNVLSLSDLLILNACCLLKLTISHIYGWNWPFWSVEIQQKSDTSWLNIEGV